MGVTGDTPLHVLARVFSSLCARVSDGPKGNSALDELGDSSETAKFVKGTQFRIQLLVSSRADLSSPNGAGKRPLDVVERRFWSALAASGGAYISRKSSN